MYISFYLPPSIYPLKIFLLKPLSPEHPPPPDVLGGKGEGGGFLVYFNLHP
jgi:hypothetical protein